MMNADDWTYVAEGGKHAVFVYDPTNRFCNDGNLDEQDGDGDCKQEQDGRGRNSADENSSQKNWHRSFFWETTTPKYLEDSVLRMRKSDLALSSTRILASSCDEYSKNATEEENSIRVMHDDETWKGTENDRLETTTDSPSAALEQFQHCRFLRNIVQSRLGRRYVDIPRVVHLDWSFVRSLRDRTLKEGRIPPSRLDSWMTENTGQGEEKEAPKNYVIATLHRDYTAPIIHHLPNMDEMGVPNIQQSATSTGGISVQSSSSSFASNSKNDDIQKLHCLSVEIKPKCGYISLTPLIHPLHRIKFHQTRYEILRCLTQHGHVRRGWMTLDRSNNNTKKTKNTKNGDNNDVSCGLEKSQYCPLDLFSGDKNRIQRAIRNLLRCPRNNLRLWCDKKILLLFSTKSFDEEVDVTNVEYRKVFQDVFFKNNRFDNGRKEKTRDRDGNSDARQCCLEDEISNLISSILTQEMLLSNVLKMQQLDVIDADGAVEIYKRLVELCVGSSDEAERLLDEWEGGVGSESFLFKENNSDFEAQERRVRHDGSCIAADSSGCSWFDVTSYDDDGLVDEKGRQVDNQLLAASPYTQPSCPAMLALLGEINTFRKVLATTDRETIDSRILDDAYNASMSHVQKLSKDGCLYLLKNWLLSLLMCDISIFITIQPVSESSVPFLMKRLSGSNGNDGVPTGSEGDQHGRLHWLMGQHNACPGIFMRQSTTSSEANDCRIRDPAEIACHEATRTVMNRDAFLYTVKIVDCDPKPARKLRNREETERIIRLLSKE